MLYDLNIAWSPSTSASDLKRTLKFSSSLGYHVVALNHSLNTPIPAQTTNPLPRFPPAPPSGPNSSSSSTTAGADQPLPEILHRATVIMADPSVNHRLPQIAAAYDILALRPQTERAFQAACVSATEASLISLDLAQRLPFYFKPKSCMAAVHRGVRFEICYAQMLGADARGRSNFIGNVMSLVRATRGRGLVVSSEARGVAGLRGPADVVNLLAVWGLGNEKGVEGLGVNPRGVVVNEGIKRRGFRGVIDIVEVAGRDKVDKMEGVQKDGQQDTGKGKEKDKPLSSGESGGNGKKRKESEPALGDGTMSKRQAKKMRKLAVIEGKADNKS